MIIPYKIVRPITTMIILNHGITDIIHARTFHLFRPLVRVNLLSYGITYILPNEIILPGFFILSSVHFHRDFPPISKPFQLFCSLLFICFLFKEPTLLFYYMVFLHVPNHFRMAWKYCKYFPIETIFIFFLSGLFIDNIIPYLSSKHIKLGLSIIMGHIVYHEIYINSNIIKKK
jgi:hypothetical protein